MADSKTGMENIQDKCDATCRTRKQESVQNTNNTTTTSICQNDTGVTGKGFQWPKLEKFEQKNKEAVLDHNPKHKRDTHEPVFI